MDLRTLGINIVRTHKIKTKDYYDKFIKRVGEDICNRCGKTCDFENLKRGYFKFCSRLCTVKSKEIIEKIKRVKIKKYGCWYNNPEKIKQTCLERYGEENVSQVSSIQKKKEKTSLKNNGYKYIFETKEHKEWMLNGGAAYCNRFIKNPSKPQLKLFKMVQEIMPYCYLNYPSIFTNYNIDIAIPALNIAVEYDGSYWHKDKEYDLKRQKELEEDGWIFIRYKDKLPTMGELKCDIMKEFQN